MSKTGTEETVRVRQIRYHTTPKAAGFVGWATPQLAVAKWELIDIGLRLLHEKLSEIYDEVPNIDVGEYDFDQLRNDKGTGS